MKSYAQCIVCQLIRYIHKYVTFFSIFLLLSLKNGDFD